MRQMWAEFVREHPHLRTTSLRRRNKGPVISFSAFRNLFNSELKDVLIALENRGLILAKYVTKLRTGWTI